MRTLVDSHTHLLPPGLARAIRGFFEEHIGDRLVHTIDPEAVLDRLAADGVETVWNLPYVRLAGRADALNASMAEVAAGLEGHAVTVVTGCTAHPGDPDPGATIDRAVERHGARVVKLHCSVGDFDADDRRLDPVYSRAAHHRLPVVVHAGHGVGGHTEHDELDPVARVADRFGDTVIVLAHLGHRAAPRAVELMATRSNLWGDLTPVVDEIPPISRAHLDRIADRLLLGTDAPNTGRFPLDLVRALEDAGVTETELAAITAGNARRLVPG